MTLTTAFVSPFDPRAAPPKQRLAVGQLKVDVFTFAYPAEPPLSAEKQALELTQQTSGECTEHVVIWAGQQAVGWGSLNYDTEQDTHLAHARLIVRPQHRRRGLGRALPTRQSRLELAGVDPDLVARWLIRPAGGPDRPHIWDGPIPGEYLERMADLMMVMNSAPKGELEMDDWRITPEMIRGWEANAAESGERELLIAVEDTRSGELVGYTDVSWAPERASIVHQGSTAVRPAARGQGLGKWLKAAMLDHLVHNAPEARVIQTNNAEENAAMLGINVALGFKPWVAITEWQLKLK